MTESDASDDAGPARVGSPVTDRTDHALDDLPIDRCVTEVEDACYSTHLLRNQFEAADAAAMAGPTAYSFAL